MTALFANNKTPNITFYDLVKTFALITMIIDHLGGFIFLDSMMLKAIGRCSFPIWLFLVGYSNRRTIPMRLWVGTGLITLSYLAFHHQIFPLNIFATIIIARLSLLLLARPFFYTPLGMASILVAGVAVLLPTYGYVEYGVTGILFAFWGHLRRENSVPQWLQHTYLGIIAVIHGGLQSIIYPFSTFEQNIAFLGVIGIMILMHLYFKPMTYPKTENIPVIAPFLRLCGRYTLEIYVFHIILFTIISGYLYGDLIGLDIFGITLEIPSGGFTRK